MTSTWKVWIDEGSSGASSYEVVADSFDVGSELVRFTRDSRPEAVFARERFLSMLKKSSS